MTCSIEVAILGVRDFEAASNRLRNEYGLGTVDQFSFPGTGVENRVVPLGSQVVELVGIVDSQHAKENWLGQWLASRVSEGDRLLGWSVNASELDVVADRLGLVPTPGMGVDRAGHQWTWRLIGMQQALEKEPYLPIFFSWDDPGAALKRHQNDLARAGHDVVPIGLSWVEVEGNEARLEHWLGGERLPVRIVSGDKGLTAVGIATRDGEIVLR